MQLLPEFSLRFPETLVEAARLLSSEPDARILGGGTDLIANVRQGLAAPAVLVSLDRVPGFRDFVEVDGTVCFGAGVTLARLVNDPMVKRCFPALAEAAATIAAPPHRSVATLGGNLCLDTRCLYYNQGEDWRASNNYCLKYRGDVCHTAPQGKHCHAAYSGDLAPVLLVMQAEVEVVGATGVRRMPLPALYREDGADHLTLRQGELVAGIRLRAPAPGLRVAYRKARVRGAVDFPLAGVAVALQLHEGRVRLLRVALTGTNSYPFLLEGTDEFHGRAPEDAMLEKLKKLVQKQVSPQRTTVTAAHYRRQVAAALAARLVRELAEVQT
jgi:4-hydroxybenzoyl-CoA reductase subunit beta